MLKQREQFPEKGNPVSPGSCGKEVKTMRLYRFLTDADDSRFCHKITAALNKGWHLYGSPTYSFDADMKTMRCGQAVVKDVDGDYDPGIKLSDY